MWECPLIGNDENLSVQGGAKTMRKLLLGFGALCLASVTAPALAQDWGGYYSGYGRGYGYGYGGYADDVRQHVRECAQHERLHERLGREHAIEHAEGFDDSEDHADAHEALGEAHGEYHEDHPGLGNCGYWNRQYYRMMGGYSDYPRRYYGNSGWSFYFGN
jgi:hypothetical protein